MTHIAYILLALDQWWSNWGTGTWINSRGTKNKSIHRFSTLTSIKLTVNIIVVGYNKTDITLICAQIFFMQKYELL